MYKALVLASYLLCLIFGSVDKDCDFAVARELVSLGAALFLMFLRSCTTLLILSISRYW